MTFDCDHCQTIDCEEKPQHRVRFNTPGDQEAVLEVCAIHTYLIFEAASQNGVVEVIEP